MVSGCVKDKTTLEPIPDATVFLLDIERGQVLIIKTNEKGCFRTPVKKGRPYACKAKKSPYLPDCLSFRIDTLIRQIDLSIPRDLLLDKLEMNKRFTLENIFYDFDKWNIRPDAEPSLNNLVRILKENLFSVELGSHTDCRGSEEYNRILSQKRAESAVRYIVHQGIDPGRIIAKGHGKSQLINRCNCAAGKECTEAEHQVNRRTEFRIIGLSDQKINPPYEPDSFKAGEILNVRELPEEFFGKCKIE
jgi:outer membrane protein OmpA-like peptidoglycan-associated protein